MKTLVIAALLAAAAFTGHADRLQAPPSMKLSGAVRQRREELAEQKARAFGDLLLQGGRKAAVDVAKKAGAPSPFSVDTDGTASSTAATTGAPIKYKVNYVPTFRFPVTAGGGADLLADATYPTPDASRPNERFPLVLFPNSWGIPHIEYILKIMNISTAGYVCVEYQTRGWYSATGEINTNGPFDRSDGSELISHILANYKDAWRIDEKQIAFGGISYGAGISLMMAGHDPRVKTAIALSGWGNLTESMYENSTPSRASLGLLVSSARLLGKPPRELIDLHDSLIAHENMPTVKAYSNERSAERFLPEYKKKNVPIFIGHGYHDRFFSPQGVTSFWQKLQVTKKFLILSNGPHAFPELTGLINLENYVWTKASQWLDAVLKGADNGILSEPRVQLQLGDSLFSHDFVVGKEPPPPYVNTVMSLTPRAGDGERMGGLAITKKGPLVATDEDGEPLFTQISVAPKAPAARLEHQATMHGLKALAKAGVIKGDMQLHEAYAAITEHAGLLKTAKAGFVPQEVEEAEEKKGSSVLGEDTLGACSVLWGPRAPAADEPLAASNTIAFSKNVTLNLGNDAMRTIGIPQKTQLNAVNAANTLVFTSKPLELPGRLCGFPELRNIKVRPHSTATNATSTDFQLYFYLYAVDNWCSGTIISDGVYTRWHDDDEPKLDPTGKYFVIPSVKLRGICTTVPMKQRVALGITLYNENFQPASESISVTFDYDSGPSLHLPFV